MVKTIFGKAIVVPIYSYSLPYTSLIFGARIFIPSLLLLTYQLFFNRCELMNYICSSVVQSLHSHRKTFYLSEINNTNFYSYILFWTISFRTFSFLNSSIFLGFCREPTWIVFITYGYGLWGTCILCILQCVSQIIFRKILEFVWCKKENTEKEKSFNS